MFTVFLRFYEELNDFLRADRRKTAFPVSFPEKRSVKDLIESLGVPHTEVDLVLVNGRSTGFDYRPQDGDRIAVYPVFEAIDITSISRLGRPPLRKPAFIADVHLGKLVRRLRLLGLDTAFIPNASDERLVAISLEEHRIILSRDRGLLKHRAVTHGICPHSTCPDEQAREVIRRIDLERFIRPFSRCLLCNGRLRAAEKNEVGNRLPAKTARFAKTFTICPSCEKVYWPGAHWAGLHTTVRKILEGNSLSEP